MTPEIRKLQMLNDLISQTLDALTQRVAFGGFAPNPYAPEAFGAFQGFGTQVPFWPVQAGLAHSPAGFPQTAAFAGPYGIGAPILGPTATGLSHTPFGPWQGPGVFPQAGTFPSPYGLGTPIVGPMTSGLSHTPFGLWQNPGVFPQAGTFPSPYGLGAPIVGPMTSGLSHTPFGVQSSFGPTLGYVDPRLIELRLNEINRLNQIGRLGVGGYPYGSIL